MTTGDAIDNGGLDGGGGRTGVDVDCNVGETKTSAVDERVPKAGGRSNGSLIGRCIHIELIVPCFSTNYKTGRDNHSTFRFIPFYYFCVPVLFSVIDQLERHNITYSASHLSNTPHNSPLQPTTMTSDSLYRRPTANSQKKPPERTNSAHFYHFCLYSLAFYVKLQQPH